MTRDEIDIIWSRALMESVNAGEEFTRYRFANMIIEECAKVCSNNSSAEGCASAIREMKGK